MALGPPSWIGPPSIATPPPETLRALKRDASNRNNDPTKPQGPDYSLWKRYQESREQDGRKKRRWRRMIPKAKAYLSKASAYGGGNSDERGALPSLPVFAFSHPGVSRLLACQHAGARDRKKTLSDSIVPRAPGLPLENACVNFFFFFKGTSNSFATASNKRLEGN